MVEGIPFSRKFVPHGLLQKPGNMLDISLAKVMLKIYTWTNRYFNILMQ